MSAGVSRRAFVLGLAGLGAATLLDACGGQVVPPTQAPRLRRIGYLSGNATWSVDELNPPFRQELRDLGYVLERDVDIVYRIADTKTELLDGMAAELVNMPVDVLVAEAGPAQLAAKRATTTIPIVFVLASDPVGLGLVASLGHPGGNITGVTTLSGELSGKRVEVLKEAVPSIERLAVIWNANQGASMEKGQVIPTLTAATTLGLEAKAFGVRNADQLDAALEEAVRQRFDGLLMPPALSVVRMRSGLPAWEQVPEFAAKHRLPAIYSDIQFAKAGGLLHLGANYAAIHRRAADFVDKILKGANPADIPVEQPTQFDFVVNLLAAQRLGLTIPTSVLLRGEIIR